MILMLGFSAKYDILQSGPIKSFKQTIFWRRMHMNNYKFMLLDSMEKVFPNQEPKELKNAEKQIYALCNETVSLQLAYTMEYDSCDKPNESLNLVIESEYSEDILARRVELVPVRLPAYRYEYLDDTYLFKEPCLCPDLLVPLQGNSIKPVPHQWRAVWFTIHVTSSMRGKCFPVTIAAERDGNRIWQDTFYINVSQADLPKQTLIHTEWFHADCLADYYKVPVFSEEHWRIIEKFVESAVAHGINMILTPVFTPPLDTKKGGERTTVQLVGVVKENGEYTFDFSLLKRWIEMCKRTGVEYLEISHLFTQWGAEFAPKIVAYENGIQKKIFGWDTPATGKEYQAFLHAFIPKLKEFLRQEGVLENTYFHISDEPTDKNKETYLSAKSSIEDLLKDCKVIDAMSSYELYESGIVENPVVSSDHIQAFLDAKVKNLWTYYCSAQGKQVSNRFMSLPSYRNRILGVQLYLYQIEGFLHWGFNFYNCRCSLYPVNPFYTVDADYGFSAGDPFLVYPGENGVPYDSIRFEVLTQAMYDLRSLQKLEELTSREYVIDLIQKGQAETITFKDYPADETYIRNLRRQIYNAIEENTK